MSTITLTSDYGYKQYKISSGLSSGSLLDASDASWIVSNSGTQNPYPVQVINAGSGTIVRGGTINGTISQTADWRTTYDLGNSAAIRVENSPGVIIDDWRIDKAWDAIRIAGGSSNFVIDDAYLTNIRDDAVENDAVLSGTIRDSLFDGVFSGVSLGDGAKANGSNNTVTMDGVLMRMKSYEYKGKITHVSPIKANNDAPETTPDLRFINTVIAIEDPNHDGQGRLKIAWDHVVESRGNVFLNLSDKPLPSNYPKPPAGWTILQGQAARDYWNKAKSAWLDAHDGTGDTAPAPTPVPTEPAPMPEPVPTPTEPTPTNPSTIKGTSRSDSLKGTSKGETIEGLGGNDILWGKGGADILKGGSGKDIFVFDTALGSGNVDTIVDFNVKDDTIYLDNAIFKKLGSGSMSNPKKISSGYFEIRDRATESNDFLLYNKKTGQLLYDADANKPGAPVEIAKMAPGLNLTSYDFYII